jgi:hypothetical protein
MTARGAARIDAPMLIDSDVLVWLTPGHVGAAQQLHALPAWRISAVTYIELAQGCRDFACSFPPAAPSHCLRIGSS